MLLFVANRYVADTVPIESWAGLRLISASETADTTGNGGDLGLAAWCVGSSVARSETRLQIINAEEESSNSSLQSIEQHSSRREGVSREVQREELNWDDKRSWRQARARGLGRRQR